MGKRKKQRIGTKWSLGQHLVLCHGPVDSVDTIWFGEKVGWKRGQKPPPTIEQPQGKPPIIDPEVGMHGDIERIKIEEPQLFGASDQEGGVVGYVDIMLGKPSQQENDYLKKTFAKGKAISAFRYLVSLVFRQVYMGNSPYPPAVSAEAVRIQTGWDGNPIWSADLADTGNGLNAAHIIYESTSCPEWGAGTKCNEASFRKAAEALKREKFGLNNHWMKQQAVEDFVKEICRYINATVYDDEASGEVAIKLIRDDYKVDDVLTIDDVVKVANVRRRSMSDTVNTVTVTYTDPKTFKQASVVVRNTAMLNNSRKPVGKTIAYPMIHDAELAYQVAMRELRVFSTPFISADVYVDTRYAHLQPADVVKVVDAKSGLNHIFRIHSKRRGTPNSPTIRLQVVEDVFAPTFGLYTPPPSSDWTKPNLDAIAVSVQTLMESPYWLVATTLTPSELKLVDKHTSGVMWLGRAPTQSSTGAEIWFSNAQNYLFSHQSGFSSYALITGAFDHATDQIAVSEPIIDTLPCLAVIDDEIIRIDAQNGNTLTISRGMLDTVPAKHNSGAVILTFTDEPIQFEFEEGEHVEVKALTTTGGQTLELDKANTLSIDLSARQARPLPPCNVQFNGSSWAPSVTLPLSITWTARERLSEVVGVASLTAWKNGVTPTKGNVSVKVLDSHGGVILSRDNLTPPLTLDAELKGHSEVTVELKTVESGVESFQTFKHKFKIAP
ncbi:phage tail protein [Vibrio harveyi]|uniref:phage tail protein n=1 Tax=Vibrio harveyi TaxID=669 RepID=UPI00247FCFFD|nr:phage tail protein [Vibrio harveyi]